MNSISKSGLSDAQKLSLLERETSRIKASSIGGTTASTKPGIAQVWLLPITRFFFKIKVYCILQIN
jgi:hypothetical protein